MKPFNDECRAFTRLIRCCFASVASCSAPNASNTFGYASASSMTTCEPLLIRCESDSNARSTESTPRPHNVANAPPSSAMPVIMQICSFDRPRFLRLFPRCRAGLGSLNFPRLWLPVKLSRTYVSSNSTDSPARAWNAGRYCSMQVMRRTLMSHAVLSDTRHLLAHSLRGSMSMKHSTYSIHLPTGSLLRPISVSLLAVNVRRQSRHW